MSEAIREDRPLGARNSQRTFVGAVVIGAVLSITACSSSGDDSAQDDEIAGDVTAASEGAESVSSSGDVEIATAFWEAVAAGDRQAALDLVDPAFVADGAGNTFGRARTLERQFDWYDAVGWQWTLDECVAQDADDVECVAAASNAWSDALGIEPVTAAFRVDIGDNGILTITDRASMFSRQWAPNVFGVFESWVRANHPDDVVMFTGQEVDSEILSLYEVNTERFVAAQTDQ